ncbi:hypothetical protein EW026_g1213 [Hermanssonia centrifuga]|uniref:NAD(P)-binding domain-containing protein n=1 Tax=Hermanssonia centrifuga TaxID=98765 RepID=A0A4S4KU40_9APHY|nr:hypothetical protein EW026_g1213 [Hermanssonia centrifuga]
MHLLILGGTGPCGLLLIQEALEAGHTVVVLVRSPQKLPDSMRSDPSITIVEGQLTDRDTVGKALQGVDAVLSALGPPVKKGIFYPSDTPLAHAYSVVIEVMKTHGVKRLIALGTASIKDDHDKHSIVFAALVSGVAIFAHNAYKDVVAIGELIRGQGVDLDSTIVRVPVLTNDAEKTVVAGYIGDGKVKPKLSRAGFASFSLQQLTSDEWAGKAPLISSP